jgi:hypothetical protein
VVFFKELVKDQCPGEQQESVHADFCMSAEDKTEYVVKTSHYNLNYDTKEATCQPGYYQETDLCKPRQSVPKTVDAGCAEGDIQSGDKCYNPITVNPEQAEWNADAAKFYCKGSYVKQDYACKLLENVVVETADSTQKDTRSFKCDGNRIFKVGEQVECETKLGNAHLSDIALAAGGVIVKTTGFESGEATPTDERKSLDQTNPAALLEGSRFNPLNWYSLAGWWFSRARGTCTKVTDLKAELIDNATISGQENADLNDAVIFGLDKKYYTHDL